MKCSIAVSSIAAVMLLLPIAHAQQRDVPASRIDPRVDAVLRKMSASLAGARQFTLESHDWVDRFSASGQKIQIGKHVNIAVRRPDALSATIAGDEEQTRFVFSDGKVLIANLLTNCHANEEAPRSIDEMFDFLAEKFGLTAPLCDLVFSDPYKVLTDRVRQGEYVGLHQVMGQKCHHLAFRQDEIDWQIWIEDSERAVPRKVVITHKELPGSPQFIALLDGWNLDAQIPASAFDLRPPPESKQIKMVPIDPTPARHEQTENGERNEAQR